MKLNGKMMVAAVLMLGTVGATGCSTANAAETAVAPDETPATAPVESTAAVQKDARFFRFYAPVAPPAPRFEVPGVAPSARHFWAPGYYRWTGREHVWVGGSWVLGRPGLTFVAPRWERAFGNRWGYRPGHWARL